MTTAVTEATTCATCSGAPGRERPATHLAHEPRRPDVVWPVCDRCVRQIHKYRADINLAPTGAAA